MRQPYLMWFMRFGSTNLVTQSSLEDCYELEYMLDNADTSVFDQYGVLRSVEHVETGIVPDNEWDAGLEKYIEKCKREDAKEAVKSPRPRAAGRININPPEGFRSPFSATYRTYINEDEMFREYHTLSSALGDRVSLDLYTEKAAE